jgi:CubicO group peptidase (beta-lactamase class C family)
MQRFTDWGSRSTCVSLVFAALLGVACSESTVTDTKPTGVGGSSATGGVSSTQAGSAQAGSTQAVQQPGALVSYLGDPAYPDDFWTTTTPEQAQIDATGIANALARIASNNWEIHSFVVARNGKLVFEYYGWKTGKNADDPDKSPHQVVPTERHPVHSTTKSVSSSLIGIALDEGLIPSVDLLIVPYFPEYQPLPEASADKDSIKLVDVLTMRSGLKWSEGNADYAIFNEADPALAMLSRPVVDTPVGTVWNYSSGGSEILTAVLRKATAKTPLEYANEKLFGPIGLKDLEWEASANGTNHGGWGLHFSGREMARFGELYRNRGVWNGVQVVPAEWTDVATTAHCTTPWSGQYGYQFWIPNLPGVFGTRGAYGQDIYVSRDLGLVVAFTSDLPVGSADSVLDGFYPPSNDRRSIALSQVESQTLRSVPVLKLFARHV